MTILSHQQEIVSQLTSVLAKVKKQIAQQKKHGSVNYSDFRSVRTTLYTLRYEIRGVWQPCREKDQALAIISETIQLMYGGQFDDTSDPADGADAPVPAVGQG